MVIFLLFLSILFIIPCSTIGPENTFKYGDIPIIGASISLEIPPTLSFTIPTKKNMNNAAVNKNIPSKADKREGGFFSHLPYTASIQITAYLKYASISCILAIWST